MHHAEAEFHTLSGRFSETSDLAVQYALAIARTNGASLTLLHVVAPAMAALPGEAGLLAFPD